jgi:PAS domain S-box-containing protein
MRRAALRWATLAAALALAGPCQAPASGAAEEAITIGVIANRPEAQTARRWEPLATYLGRGLGREVKIRALDHAAMDQAARERSVELLIPNPAHYILIRERAAFSGLIATLVEQEGDRPLTAIGGVVFTRADRRDLVELRDLRGKRVAVIDPHSLGGYQAPLLELRRAGVRAPEEMTLVLTGQPQDRVVEAVMAGRADAGFIHSGLIEQLVEEKALESGRVKVLNRQDLPSFPYLLSTRLYPQQPVIVLPHVPDEVSRRVASLLLAMPAAQDARGRRYWFTTPAEYHGVEDLLRELRLPPYEGPPPFLLADAWGRYRWPLASILLCAGLTLAVSIRSNRRLARGVAELRAAQAAMARSEEQLRVMVERAPVGIALTESATGLMTVTNPRLAEIMGCRPEELRAVDWRRVTHPDDLPDELAQLAKMQAGEIPGYRVQKRIQRPDGATAWVEVTVARAADLGGTPHHLAMVEDVTGIREAGERLRAVTDSAQDAIAMMDSSGAVTLWNPAAQRILGYRADEVMGENLHALLAPARFMPAHRAAFPGFVRTGRGPVVNRVVEVAGRHKDGREIPFLLSLSAVSLRGAWHAVGILHDISERKRYEAELLGAKQAAEAANAAKSTFLAHMSHEIRTPLNAVLGLAQLLEREPLSGDQRAMVGRIGAAGSTLLGALNDLLDLSRIESGQVVPEAQPFRLAPLLDQVHGVYAPLAQAKGLDFRRDESTGLPGQLVGDPGRLAQILNNLVANALKFTARGEIRLRVRVVAETEGAVRLVSTAPKFTARGEVCLRFEVQDTGIGIDPAALETLFIPFVQADPSITRRYGGTGLGLTISKRLAEMMGGAIGAASTAGAGSTFWVELPFPRIADAAPAPAADAAPARRAEEPPA